MILLLTISYFHSQEEEEVIEEVEPKKVKTRGGKLGEAALDQSTWSQVQQKAFEAALQKFPKSLDRWDKIAKSVPGKTKVFSYLKTCIYVKFS